ncbi:MAG: DNA-protecting protein DprA [Oscillospiraceae bacterium]|nr:DNA-protecting protein DprA [Oscillospiraceae bacterium]
MLLNWVWLSTRRGIGPRGVQKALRYFETPEEIYRAGEDEYRLAGLGEAERRALADKDLEAAQAVMNQCARLEVHILTYQDAAYPARLRSIADPPTVLYYAGVLPDLDGEPLVAVVGSRRSSPYGMSCAKRLGYQIGRCGGIVVSGLALGGDAMAMLGAVSAGRPVVGVLGCGVDVVYPRSNRHLYDDVRRRGCLLSEYPPGTPPVAGHFPARNRIISGLSLGIVVVEAPRKSGTLITADLALEQGRDVFAVPGNAGLACCAGSNQLLREGAILVETGWDVMREYADLYPDRIQEYRAGEGLTASMGELRDHRGESSVEKVAQTVRRPRLAEKESDKKSVDNPENTGYIDVQAALRGASEDERQVLLALQQGERHVDALAAQCGLGAGRVLAALTILEIKQQVQRLPGNRYALARA